MLRMRSPILAAFAYDHGDELFVRFEGGKHLFEGRVFGEVFVVDEHVALVQNIAHGVSDRKASTLCPRESCAPTSRMMRRLFTMPTMRLPS